MRRKVFGETCLEQVDEGCPRQVHGRAGGKAIFSPYLSHKLMAEVT